LGGRRKTAKLPWVLEVPAKPLSNFEKTSGALFLANFGHPPNVRAMQFFVHRVLPKIRERFPDFRLRIAGGQLVAEVEKLESASVEIVGYVADLDEVFRASRVFVAPLLAGAGIKGKVLEAAARGVPSVLSRIAVEGTGLVDGVDCLIAEDVDSWVNAVARLNTDELLWSKLAQQSQDTVRGRFSFDVGLDTMAEALAMLDIYGRRQNNLVYKNVRPHKYGWD
jgi:glycosyltransferase involved in cell wall biosynthesis